MSNFKSKTCLNLENKRKEENMTEDKLPVAVACWSLCEVGTRAMCKRLGPH